MKTANYASTKFIDFVATDFFDLKQRRYVTVENKASHFNGK